MLRWKITNVHDVNWAAHLKCMFEILLAKWNFVITSIQAEQDFVILNAWKKVKVYHNSIWKYVREKKKKWKII